MAVNFPPLDPSSRFLSVPTNETGELNATEELNETTTGSANDDHPTPMESSQLRDNGKLLAEAAAVRTLGAYLTMPPDTFTLPEPLRNLVEEHGAEQVFSALRPELDKAIKENPFVPTKQDYPDDPTQKNAYNAWAKGLVEKLLTNIDPSVIAERVALAAEVKASLQVNA